MKRIFLIAGAALALAACQTTSPSAGINTGFTPLASTSVDNRGIAFAFEAADTITTLVDIARDAGKLVPGTPRAQQVAGYLRTMATALRAASAAQRVGDTGKVAISLDEAARLVTAIRTTLNGGN